MTPFFHRFPLRNAAMSRMIDKERPFNSEVQRADFWR
jgi:hypothetical protein